MANVDALTLALNILLIEDGVHPVDVEATKQRALAMSKGQFRNLSDFKLVLKDYMNGKRNSIKRTVIKKLHNEMASQQMKVDFTADDDNKMNIDHRGLLQISTQPNTLPIITTQSIISMKILRATAFLGKSDSIDSVAVAKDLLQRVELDSIAVKLIQTGKRRRLMDIVKEYTDERVDVIEEVKHAMDTVFTGCIFIQNKTAGRVQMLGALPYGKVHILTKEMTGILKASEIKLDCWFDYYGEQEKAQVIFSLNHGHGIQVWIEGSRTNHGAKQVVQIMEVTVCRVTVMYKHLLFESYGQGHPMFCWRLRRRVQSTLIQSSQGEYKEYVQTNRMQFNLRKPPSEDIIQNLKIIFGDKASTLHKLDFV
eukprot:178304_1